LDKIKLSPPATDDEILHITVEADFQTDEMHAEDPTLVEEEYSCGAIILATNLMLAEPELGAFRPMLE
jgi:hypothetical protein